jgi:hypothetical protein
MFPMFSCLSNLEYAIELVSVSLNLLGQTACYRSHKNGPDVTSYFMIGKLILFQADIHLGPKVDQTVD